MKKYPDKLILSAVLFIIVLVVGSLAATTTHINFWPTDSFTPYIPTARQLFEKSFLSQMHSIPAYGILRVTMRGKEALILGIALMQKVLGDTKSLYPNILLLILATGISSLCMFLISRKFFNTKTALIVFGFFITCFWPYLYVLQGAHQPLVLMNFLIATLTILTFPRWQFCLLSGIFLGLMFFSSPTSPLYLPYYGGALIASIAQNKSGLSMKRIVTNIAFIILGTVLISLLFLLPNPANNIKGFIHFLRFSQQGNNFALYKNYLNHYGFNLPEQLRGGGLIWIIRYFLLIMPAMFPLYLTSALSLLVLSLRRRAGLWIVLLSLTSPLAVELSGVAQFGRNYFPWLIGMLLVIATAFYYFDRDLRTRPKTNMLLIILVVGSLSIHVIFNAIVFAADIYPARMATTRIHDWLIQKGEQRVYVYARHPRNLNFVRFLNNPKQEQKIDVIPVRSIRDAKDGYFLVPPITGKSILQECRLGDFQDDIYLTELYNSAEFRKYVAASFPTLASSRYWNQEEEICTYLDLMLNEIGDDDRDKGYVFLLDTKIMQRDWFSRIPKPLKFY